MFLLDSYDYAQLRKETAMQNLGLGRRKAMTDAAAHAFTAAVKSTRNGKWAGLWAGLAHMRVGVVQMEDLPEHLRRDLGLPVDHRTRPIAPLTLHHL